MSDMTYLRLIELEQQLARGVRTAQPLGLLLGVPAAPPLRARRPRRRRATLPTSRLMWHLPPLRHRRA